MNMSGKIYRARAGEAVDSIAYKLYGDEKYAAELLCCNPENSGKILMTGGEIFYLPVIETMSKEKQSVPETAPWKE